MSLRLDNYVKRKEITKINKIDRRKYRISRNRKDILLERLNIELNFLGIVNKQEVSSELIKLPNFGNLNFRLIILVYRYFAEKNFDINNVVIDFDNDFEKIIQEIKKLNIFNLEKSNALFKFRQDFIIYLILIHNIPADEVNEDIDVEQLEDITYTEASEDKDYNRLESLRDDYEYRQEMEAEDEFYI